MFDLDKWQEIFESISRHKLRTALTAFGVAWGIFMLVLLLGAGNGLRNGVEYSFMDEAINSIWMSPGRTSKPYKGLTEGRSIKFDNDDFDFIQEQYSEVDNVSGRFFLSGDKSVNYKDKKLAFSVNCIHPSFQVIENMIVTQGRFLIDKDLEDFRKVCVIGRIVREKLFDKDEDPIGKEIEIDKVIYKVVGVFYDTGGEWVMKNIYIPITTAQKVYSGQNRLHRIALTASGLDEAGMAALQEQVVNDFAARKKFDPTDRRAMRAYNNAEEFKSIMGLMNAIAMITWLVGIFSIIAGVIGVSNIMLIIVKDRTKEIGIRKALGATPRSIISMILQESVLITSIAGYFGLALGVGAVALMGGADTQFFRHPEVNIGVAILATMVLVVTGALAGLIPAMQAAKINPVIAMKSD